MISETRYARADDVHIAYRVIGDGPIDLIANTGYLSHVEHILTEPRIANLFERMGEFARVLIFDRRGIGLSDPVDRAPTLEQQVDDALAVLDAESVERAAVYGFTVGAPFALLLAASEPERITHVITSSGFARMSRTDDYPYGNPIALRNQLIETTVANWGNGNQVAAGEPSLVGDPGFRAWGAALERLSTSPGSAKRFLELVGDIDVRPVLASVHQPALVMHPEASVFFEPGHSKYLARELPNAKYLNLPGGDLIPITPEGTDATLDAMAEFLTGERPTRRADRSLRTLLFTDIVDSTQTAADIGDREWHTLLDRHDAASRREILGHRGSVVKTTGDGFFASFDGPERAVRCARAIQDSVSGSGIHLRAGVHTGECEVRGDDLAGISVHIGARVAAAAAPDEVLISRTVKDLVVGSDLEVEPRGEHELKGVPGTWELYAVS